MTEPVAADAPDAPVVAEEVVPLALNVATERLLAESLSSIIQNLGATLVTVSLWRPATRDLVRVASSLPGVYRVGGISSGLGADWIERCVVKQQSYVADDAASMESEAFEHHDVLAALRLGAAINSVVTSDGVFLGCLNALGPAGAFGDGDGDGDAGRGENSVGDADAALAEADRVAGLLVGTLQSLAR